MGEQSSLAQAIESTQAKSSYDAACKRLLSEKIILAHIMQQCLEEYKGLEVEDIVKYYIEGDIKSLPGENMPKIRGVSKDENSVEDGAYSLDVYFTALTKDKSISNRIYIDIEAQGKYYLKYPIEKRGLYYCSRMISSQYGTEFKRSEYGKLKKVYSIWICNNSPKYKRNTITSYHMTKDMLVGYIRKEKESYDLMHVIRICLGEPEKAEKGSLLRLLDTLFSVEISADDKKRLLVDEFHIELEDSLERKVEDVCTFSEGVEYRAKKRGTREGRKIGDAVIIGLS